MIVWRGRGFIVALVTFGCLVAADGLTAMATGDSNFYAAHGWPKLLAFWVAAAGVYALRSTLGVPPEANMLARVPKGQGPANEGELFFVRARHWPAILLGLGGLFLFVAG